MRRRADHRRHDRATEAASALDRDYFRRHPEAREYVRRALLHELCPPGAACVPLAGKRVHVVAIAPGVRGRSVA